MEFEFDGEIKQLEGKIKWQVIYFPYSVLELFQTNGNVPVLITADHHEFEHTLLPSKNGHYLVYNEFMRRALNKKLGDSVHITLQKQEGKRELLIPDYIYQSLQERNLLTDFLSQPSYIKKEQIDFIELAKKEETRNSRLITLEDKIKRFLSNKK
ncbi:MAG: DUF1905 domain-containing protein [Clostridiales bacterium]|nr:DUF1905 domain-containing protein [Clostridiales bacterium]